MNFLLQKNLIYLIFNGTLMIILVIFNKFSKKNKNLGNALHAFKDLNGTNNSEDIK